MNAPRARILIVDDEASLMRALCHTLEDQGYEARGFTRGEDAIEALRAQPFDLLLTDLMMPGMDGVALLGAALNIDPQLVGVLMTGMGTIETAVQAMQAGAHDYILKPFKLSAILPVLERALEVRRLRMENMELHNTMEIHELNLAFAHSLDSSELLNRIADAAIAQFEADEASVMLADNATQRLHVAVVRGNGRETLSGAGTAFGEGIAGWVALHREPVILGGDVVDPRVVSLHPRRDILSSFSIPMETRGKLIGVLNVNCTRRRRSFSSGQIKALSLFTNAAAAWIEAARLHEERRKADARYREVLDMAADGIVSMDSTHRITVFNRGAEDMFGYRADEAIGNPLGMLLPEASTGIHGSHVDAFGRGAETSRVMGATGQRLYGRRKDGSLVDVEIAISRRTENTETLYTAVIRDITQRVRQEDQIARLTRLYAMLSGVNSAIVRLGDEAAIYAEICRIAVEEGRFASAWIGTYTPEGREINLTASAGSAVTEGRIVIEDRASGSRGLLARAAIDAQIVWDNDLTTHPDFGFLRRSVPHARSGAALPFILGDSVKAVMLLYAATPGAFGDDEINLLRELAGDVSFALDHIAKTRRVDYLATHDQLTGLPNRTLFLDRLEQVAVTAQDNGQSLAVILVDIEHFKHINDAFGRQYGDKLLQQLAQRFRAAVEDRASLARVGADIFSVIYHDAREPTDVAKLVLRRMEKSLAEAFNIDGQPLQLAARAGAAFYPTDGADAETLFKNAEAALKRAKTQRERIVFYTPDLNARVASQLAMESKLRRALEREEFVLHYQPKVDLRSWRVVGLEALIRWQDPETGLVPPMQFISLLEQTGLILEVGRWAMTEALRMVDRLRGQGLPPVRIAVNVSPIQLRQKEFVASVEAAIASAGGDAHGLDIEITESVIMEDIEANVKKLSALRDMEVELAIDDFGTGYSSLAYIALLPVGVIKIDRSFIRNLPSGGDNASIVESIISLTHALKRKVVAEGVETTEQAERLQQLHCDQFQGYLFSKPVAGDQIETMLRAGLPH